MVLKGTKRLIKANFVYAVDIKLLLAPEVSEVKSDRSIASKKETTKEIAKKTTRNIAKSPVRTFFC